MINPLSIQKAIRLTFALLLFVLVSGNLAAQQTLSDKDIVYFKKQELRLQALQKKIYTAKTDSLKMALNKAFLELWDTTLTAELSFSFPFDSLNQVGRLISPDKNFRIINWNIDKKDGSHLFFGFIQTYDKQTKKYNVEKLIDKSGTIKNPETFIGSPEKWFGMLYYDIIKTDDYYTLLAWDGNDKLTCRKFIDIMYFKDNGDIVFGKDVFKMPQKNPRRVVFEYSAELVMSLKYLDDKGMIVFDHLAPKDEYMIGQYQYYGPDFSYDAYDFSKGKWKFIADVDVKNLKDKNDNAKHNNRKEKPIYVPH
ncbi:MAG: hypothetical protein K0S33_2940 [Bacteroidetes bacterium]|nr:hypothetical protein [Bacteroidota bacterium]